MKTPQQDFTDNVIKRFEETITDKVFLMIQTDRELFHKWLDLLEGTPRNVVNGSIAKALKERFHLINKATRKNKPESFLIKSFQEFEK